MALTKIGTAAIDDDAITAAKIATDAVDSAEIAADAVTASEIAANAVTTAEILDANVTLAKIADAAANTVLVRDASSSGVVSAKAVATTEILIGDGTGFTAAALSGDTTMTNAGAVTIANNAVSLAKMAGLTRGSLIIGDSSGDPSALAKGTDNYVLTSDGTDIAWEAAAGGLPTQTSKDGYTLITDGTDASWARSPTKNYLINGNFDVWQRGTSFAGMVQSYTNFQADHWNLSPAGNSCVMTVTRQAFTVGQTDVPNDPRYYLRADITTAASPSGTGELTQPIEDVYTLAGKVVVISFWAKTIAGTLNFGCRVKQNFGSGGSGLTHTTLGTASLTTTWTKFEFTGTVPSISGKTVGVGSWLGANFTFDNAATTYDIEIAQFQLEEGAVATPFEYQTPGQTLAACQRYYEKSYDVDATPGTTPTKGAWLMRHPTAGAGAQMIQYRVTKRTLPTSVTYSRDAGTSGKVTNMSGGASDITGTFINAGDSTNCVYWTSTGSETYVEGQWTAEAELT